MRQQRTDNATPTRVRRAVRRECALCDGVGEIERAQTLVPDEGEPSVEHSRRACPACSPADECGCWRCRALDRLELG